MIAYLRQRGIFSRIVYSNCCRSKSDEQAGNVSNGEIGFELADEFRKEELRYPKTNLKLDNSLNQV